MKEIRTSRRGFVAAGSMAALSPVISIWGKSGPIATANSEVHDRYPQTQAEQARAIVGASHAQIDTVKSLLKENQALAKASWDWGFGDWETAIGAASHTGRRDIIDILIKHGARPTLFTLAALDKVDAVRAVCQNLPNIQRVLGPHGITLYQHAVNGKSKNVIEYLQSLGGADDGLPGRSISKVEAEPYLGIYEFGPAPNDRFNVVIGQTIPRIGIERQGSSLRYMAMTKQHEFHIYGAEQVAVVFNVDKGKATSLTIQRGSFRLIARRTNS